MTIGWWIVGALAVIEGVALGWMVRRLRVIRALETRLDRMGDAMTLLTDTTEAGLSAVVAELGRVSPRRAPAAGTPRRALAKRLSSAVRRGDDIPSIASREGLSESEVRLHLAMVDSDRASARATAPAPVVSHDAAPDSSSNRPPRSNAKKGGAHASMRA